jgi:hypothetical protein
MNSFTPLGAADGEHTLVTFKRAKRGTVGEESVSRGGDERSDAGRRGARSSRHDKETATRPERAPYPRPMTEREKARNRRQERTEDKKADIRRGRPSVPEQQMLGVLAVLGERYGEDYQHEAKIKDGDWYITHADVAWPERLIIEVYGGPHYKPFFDRMGQRDEDQERRIATLQSVGWRVLIVYDYELTRDAWLATVEKVARFLNQQREQDVGQEEHT